jgi:hypothetical protein
MRLRPFAAVAVGVLAVSLSACEQPTPQVSVFSGTSSDHRQAVCWSADAQPVDLKECLSVTGAGAVDKAASLQESVGEVTVRAGATIGVSVDPEIADRGWYVTLGTNRVNVAPIEDTYYKFSLPADVVEQGRTIPMYVLAQGEATQGASGVWAFQLVPSTGG